MIPSLTMNHEFFVVLSILVGAATVAFLSWVVVLMEFGLMIKARNRG